ncbi:uncharacterized protein LOC127868775 isoform X3 [Dreissena polymorpha]|uniref:Anaphase-promoting complex subunit 4-like WD40 domain-containing protein n=1 Tax=Dreissena polymorpha TaxID=45954 RepID=A0A9D4RL79_DREPO|nr:uncharacterized protein LOC127868775 isoform X3 [Dreissena polymorpha]XP_052266797.1 uncharacterized protein LOC127868775 isoform X3 [Dreissena polymorpha]XP_052266798.1 uncharacterized protein LOC127868775 isoform X3 [Dreissena polymorpha]XP_052266799.1 uncharacterized protein LOC127868775 isoform X3 [Dreissena polymorpha]XP_052266800.1 uncharacterized protein LOC127868775 isoform X3 [Dreissena polymorpha]KAH3872444.1 hypothetical protein DPMN_035660 [Dreissena polymorpha]
MARRRLELAIQAGQSIAKGKEYPEKFSRVSVDHNITLEKEVGGVYSLQYSFDGKFLAIGCGNGTIRLFDTATGVKLPDIRKSRYGGFPIMCLRFHPKNPSIIYAGTSEGQILSCDISDFVHDGSPHDLQHVQSDKDERWHEIIRERKGSAKNEINCLDFDYTYTRYATAGKDLSIRIYDAATNQELSEYTGYDNTKDPTEQQFSGCAQRVFALRWHPEHDDVFITGGWDRQLKIWDSRNHDGVRRTIHGPHICGDALDLKGNKILTGSYVGKDALQIWNYSTDYATDRKQRPQEVHFPAGEKGPFLYAAQFCDNNVVLAGGSGTNSAKAINSETNEVLGEVKFDHPVQALDTVWGGRLFAVGDGGRSLKMCSLK